jgi:hypothetical protein
MRKVAFLAWVLGIATLALNATAVPLLPPPTATTAPTLPPPSSGAPVRIVGFAILTAPPPALYRGGPIDVRVDVENIGTSTATIGVRLTHPPIALVQTVEVPPKTTAQPTTGVTFTDEGGVDESCAPHTYSMTLMGAGTDTRGRRASVVPTCSWAPKVDDAWAAGIPDEVQRTKAYFTSVTADGPIICSSGARIRTTVMNHTATSAYLAVRAKAGETLKGQSSPLTVVAGGSASVAFGGNGSGGGVPQQLDVLLVDPSPSPTADIANRKVVVGFNRACRLAATQVSF